MIGEFRAFLLKTNAIALAIAIIIGVALGNVVNSLVNDIIMPPVGMILGGVDFSQLKIVLQANADPAKEVAIRWGIVHQRGDRVRGDRRGRLPHHPVLDQGGPGRPGQDVPVLQGSERGGRLEVQGLHFGDLTANRVRPRRPSPAG